MTLLLGVDFGTGGVRVGVFDLDKRALIGTEESTYETTFPHPGWAEQNPDDWWMALGQASRALLARLGNPPIAGIGLATTASTVVACDRLGKPLRPALLWMDCRSAEEAVFTSTVDHPVLALSGGGDASEWLVPKAMWLARHEPDLYHRADVICECIDYLNFRLTGRWVASRMNATCKWNYDPISRRFHGDLYDKFGIPDLEGKLPPVILAVGEPVGPITAAAAEHLGLAGRPSVAQGGVDAHIGMLGANTVGPGNLLMIAGTSVVHLIHLDGQTIVPGFWGPYPDALMDQHWLLEGGQVSAGSVLTWLSRKVFGLDSEGHRRLIDEAAALPAGSTKLMALDYFMGNRTPYRDPALRGAFIGLSLDQGRAQIYRAAVESLALGSANVVLGAIEAGVPCRRIVSSGGFRRNAAWLRATVDALGMPIHLPAEDNLTILGAVASAATAAGLMVDLTAAAAAVETVGSTIEPDLSAHARYRDMLGQYREATLSLRPLMHALSKE